MIQGNSIALVFGYMRSSGRRSPTAMKGGVRKRNWMSGRSWQRHEAICGCNDAKEADPVKLPLTGGCMCGAARYEITQEPIGVYTCHCTDCQRATVSAFSIGVAVPGEAFRLTGRDLQPAPGGITDGGRPKTRWVCPDCG